MATVSVVIPAYNCAAYIGETLESVFAQTFTNYEVIVINDGSPDTDELERVLQAYRDHIVYIAQANRGPGAARNAGIRAARSPLIALLDSDDAWEPDYLAVQAAALQCDPTIDMIYPNALVVGDAPEAGRIAMEVWPSEGEVTFESLVTQRCNVLVSVTARRDAIVRAGLFDEAEWLRGSEDFDLWLRIAKHGGRIAYHRRVLLRYRRRNGSLSCDPIGIFRRALRVLDKAERTLNLTPSEAEAIRHARSRFLAWLRLYEGKSALRRGDAKAAGDALREAYAFFRNPKIALALLGLRFAPQLFLHTYRVRDYLASTNGAGT